uniref:Guanylate cyclase domain-containing protein n=1 Tax=Rhabditophanes sp. KR3021 TaxID=114890 RepID=A0AC35UGY3_9BILA
MTTLFMTIAPTPQREHGSHISNLALGLMYEAKRILVPKLNIPILLKIGIHSGDIKVGIVGSSKLRYGVFGESVCIARRLCGIAVPGRILVSASTKLAAVKGVSDEFDYTVNGYVNVGTKNQLATYYLEKNTKKSIYRVVGDDSVILTGDGYDKLNSVTDMKSWLTAEINIKRQKTVINAMRGKNLASLASASEKLNSVATTLTTATPVETTTLCDPTAPDCPCGGPGEPPCVSLSECLPSDAVTCDPSDLDCVSEPEINCDVDCTEVTATTCDGTDMSCVEDPGIVCGNAALSSKSRDYLLLKAKKHARKTFNHNYKKYKGGKQCFKKSAQTHVYFSKTITDKDMRTIHGVQNGVICDVCSTGYGAFFNASNSRYIDSSFDAITTVRCQHPKNLCICSINNICYSPNSNTVSVVLYPACIKKKCHTYAILKGSKNTDGILSTTKKQSYYVRNQFDLDNMEYFPLDKEGIFLRVHTVSCDKCAESVCDQTLSNNESAARRQKILNVLELGKKNLPRKNNENFLMFMKDSKVQKHEKVSNLMKLNHSSDETKNQITRDSFFRI